MKDSTIADADVPVAIPQQTAHHIRFRDPSWAMWRWSLVRGTGFPLALTLGLSDATCLVSAEQALYAQQAAHASRQTAIAHIQQLSQVDDADKAAVKATLQSLRLGKIVLNDALPEALQRMIAPVAQEQQATDAAVAAFATAYATALAGAEQALRATIGSEPFRQAIVWQNRRLLHDGIEYYLGKPPTTTGRDYVRNRSTLLKYLQRYTTKNDTIGFFGPVGWVRWNADLPQTRFIPRQQLLAQRTTYLEGWGVNALGAALATNPDLLPWATPRLAPQFAVVGAHLYIPFGKPLPLSPAQAALLRACTGEATAQAIAQRLVSAGIPGLGSAAEVYANLAQMQKMRRITWSFDVSLETPFPERALRRQLIRIAPEAERNGALAQLDALAHTVQGVRDAVTQSAGLDRALVAVETTFTELTGAAATRSAGQVYAGRTLVYEDCARAITLDLGAEVLHALEPPLTLLLTSARWLTAQLAATCRAYLRTAYDELAQKRGTKAVEFAEFFPWVNTHLAEMADALFSPVQAEFQRKWAEILALPAGQRVAHYTVADLAPRVAAAFAATGPAWSSARYYSPDIMVAARDMAAIHQGDFTLVLGELHLSMNTLGVQLFTQQHPRISEFYAAVAEDMPAPHVIPLAPSSLLPATRSQSALALPQDFRLVTSTEVCDAPRAQQLHLGDLVVELVGDAVRARTRDGQHDFDALDVLSDYLTRIIGDYFEVLPQGMHTPRISIDQVVVTREAWRLPVSEVIAAIAAPDAATSYLHTVRWARAQGMPQHLFYRTPTERKPGFLDLASPLSVDLFVREVRRLTHAELAAAATISFSEMLPRPDQVWLTDEQGHRYTSELRLALVDRQDR